MLLDIFITLFLVLLNGFFVAAEFAIVKVRISQLVVNARTGSRSTRQATKMLKHLDDYLAATQLGITLASLGLGWVGEPVVSKFIVQAMEALGFDGGVKLAHQIALPLAFVLITVLHIVFGELAPKSLAIQRAKQTTLAVAIPLKWFHTFFRPFIWVLNGMANAMLRSIGLGMAHENEMHSVEELKLILRQSNDNGILKNSDFHLVENSLDFSDRIAKHIVIPRKDIIGLDIDALSYDDLEELMQSGYSRIPCYSGSLDHIKGLIYVKDLFKVMLKKQPLDIPSLIRPIIFTPEVQKLNLLLKEFQEHHIHLAVIVDEYGSTLGIVTLEDVLEELVGDIRDEHDKENIPVEKINTHCFRVMTTEKIHILNRYLPKPILNKGKNMTLSGMLMDHFSNIPQISDSVTIGDYKVTVLKRIRNTITIAQLNLSKEHSIKD